MVEVVADWDGWKRPGTILPSGRDDGWRVAAFEPPPGEHAYAIVDDGQWLTDANVPSTAFHDGREVTWIEVDSCDAPALRIDAASGSADGTATVDVTFLAANAEHLLDPATLSATARSSEALAPRIDAHPKTGKAHLSFAGLSAGKHVLTLSAKDAQGHVADGALATLWIETSPFEWSDSVIYQIIVDRYANESGALPPPATPSGRAGGTLTGVRRAIEKGDLTSLGVNTLWLSPLYANPSGTFPGADGRPYSAYHGYWPIAARTLEPALGSEADLDALLASAHARGIRVLFDVVPNHVHERHPYAANLNDGWFNHPDRSCMCGSATCGWDTHILDCWFAPYLPDLDWRRADVADQITSDVAWWLDRFDGDGLRIDAVPMMPRAATRRIAAAVRRGHDHPGHKTLLLGENFTSPEGYGVLKYELGPQGLDSEFHFPLMWSLRGAIAEGSLPLSSIDAAVAAGEVAWTGSGAVMALMVGNHDVARFASVSAGDADGDGWAPAPQPSDALVYSKQLLALGTTFALPGAPVLYYGDEIALAGRSDPDSRRVMPREADWLPEQRVLREKVAELGRARACLASLRRGGYRMLAAEGEWLVFAREMDGEDPAIAVLSRNPASSLVTPLPGIPAGDYVDVLTGEASSLSPALTKLDAAPFSLRLFVPATNRCLRP
jgi:glycosidase